MLPKIFSFFLFLSFIKSTYAMEITLVHGDGNTAKVDLVIIGDGYSLDDQTHYIQRVDEIKNYMFTSPKAVPYPRYQNFINIWRIDLISSESGIDNIEAGIYKNTPLDGHDGCIDYTIQQCQVNWNITHDSIDVITQQKGFTPDWFLVLLNTSDGTAAAHYASRGTLPILGTQVSNWYSRHLDIVLHEAGHAWHNLADEYHYSKGNTYNGREPVEVNIGLDSDGSKWSPWLGFQAKDMSSIGSYEGAKYAEFGIWDPTQGSKMDGGGYFDCHNMGNDCGHHAISIEKIIKDIHSIAPQVLMAPNTEQEVIDTLKIELSDSLVSQIEWYIDGKKHTNQGTQFTPHGLLPGNYDLQAIVYDKVLDHAFSNNVNPHPLDRVRRGGELLRDTLSWSLKVPQTFSTNIHPNWVSLKSSLNIKVTENSLILSSLLPDKQDYTLSIYNMAGKMVLPQYKFNLSIAEFAHKLNITNLNNGSYYISLQSKTGSRIQSFQIIR